MPQSPAAPHPPANGAHCRYVLLMLDDGASTVAGVIGSAAAAHGLVAEVVPCGCQDEAVARLGSGRRYSALVASPAHPNLDRVRGAASRVATPVILAGGPVGPADLVGILEAGATAVPRRHQAWPKSGAGPTCDPRPHVLSGNEGRRAHLIAVCGPGGTGASVIAAALSAGLAKDGPDRGCSVPCPDPGTCTVDRPVRNLLLADFALRADQAFLHQHPTPEISLLDLLARCRCRPTSPTQIRGCTIEAPGYRLLPGLRRPTHWTAVAPRVFDAALNGIRSAFDLVVADVNGDFEGEREVGSIDIEERNHMARQVTNEADLVLVVGHPGPAGWRRSKMTVDALAGCGVDPTRVQLVVNRVSGGQAVERQSGPPDAPIFVPEVVGADTIPLPAEVTRPLAALVAARLGRPSLPRRDREPTPVTAGSIGCWPGSQPA